MDAGSRESWLRIVRQQAEKRHIGWALWVDGGRFRAMNVEQGDWLAPIRADCFSSVRSPPRPWRFAERQAAPKTMAALDGTRQPRPRFIGFVSDGANFRGDSQVCATDRLAPEF